MLYWQPRVTASLIVARQVRRKIDMFFAPLILCCKISVAKSRPDLQCLVVCAVCVRNDPQSIKTQRIILKKFHCSSLLQNSGSQSFLSKSGSIHFCSFRNDSHIKGYAAKTAMQKHNCVCNTCGLCRVCADRSAFDKNKELI